MDETQINWTELGKRLEVLQKKFKPKSSRQFALAIGADPAYFKKAVDGKKISERYINEICRIFKVNKEWILFGSGVIESVDNVNTNIDNKNEQKNDFQEKYIALLEKTLQEKEREINDLKKDVEYIKEKVTDLVEVKKLAIRNSVNLETLQSNQLKAQALDYALRKMVADYIGKQMDHDPKTILRTLHRDAVQKMKAYEKTGNLLEIDT